MVHHGRWLNHQTSLLKELGKKSRKRAEELLSEATGDTVRHDARAPPVPIHIDIEARDDGVPLPIEGAGQNAPDPAAHPDIDPETDPKPNPEPNPEPVPGQPPQNPDADPSHTSPQPETTVVATIVHIVLSGGSSTIAEFTVPTLPAVVSNTALGVLTIPAETDSPITVPSQQNHNAAPATQVPIQAPVAPTPTLDAAPAPSVPVIGADESTSVPESTETTEPTETPATPAAEEATSVPTSTAEASTAEDPTTALSSETSSDSSDAQTTTLTTSSNESSYTSSASSAYSGTGSDPTIVAGAPVPAPTSANEESSDSSSSGGLGTPKLAGAVVGSIAGFAIILILILFLINRRKRHVRETRGAMLTDEPEGARSAPPRPPRPMSERFSGGPIVTTGLFNRLRQSVNSESTYETSPSERGFQKISGRKIPSVLHTGGDGYGGGGFEKEIGRGGYAAAETNPFYKETAGYGTAAASTSRAGAVARQDSDSSCNSDVPLQHSVSNGSASSEVAVMRPGPARVAITNPSVNPESGYSTPAISAPSSRGDPMPSNPFARPSMRDEVGRSLHGYDGSRGSRFRERV
ncbi:hypothetical protein FQN54_005076 [Arachnomyces sp. PD_36]|nr:hypothetical protein FQN54_005076 [Arachnomyces sp. PD_36]